MLVHFYVDRRMPNVGANLIETDKRWSGLIGNTMGNQCSRCCACNGEYGKAHSHLSSYGSQYRKRSACIREYYKISIFLKWRMRFVRVRTGVLLLDTCLIKNVRMLHWSRWKLSAAITENSLNIFPRRMVYNVYSILYNYMKYEIWKHRLSIRV